MDKQNLQQTCHHVWRKSYEECVVLDKTGEHAGVSPKWTCKKCGKVLRVNPTEH